MKFTIFLTRECNLRCKYCYETQFHKEPREKMEYYVADNVIKFIESMTCLDRNETPIEVIFHGGEPFLNFEIMKYIHMELCKKFTDKKIIYFTTTNATIINDEILEFIIHNINNLSISLDGNRDIHDKNRIFPDGSGSYEIVLKNAMKILNYKEDLRLRITFTPESVNYIYESVEFLYSRGFRKIIVVPDFMSNEWKNTHKNELFNQIEKIIYSAEAMSKLDSNINDYSFLTSKISDCFGGVVDFSIDVNGDIYPCSITVGKKEFIIGNVNNNGDRLNKESTRAIIEINKSEIPICENCTRKEYCDTNRCKLINLYINGSKDCPIPIMCALQDIYVEMVKKMKNNK
ncbi:radical SAM/SPASM domain-containing protein [Peptostreptococcus porci]|uniref:radical SAM/SPASM domain-containing protein n=1 Tax=Peptostreptococcus porci TaxID=2652282 RepID=UPI002A81A49E|nr:radical SAM protein [Peptostreptococcus porci]MDY4129019.1 radical SAM protein [Peptostreptococcus porci]MDY5436436.1 radical SAM protein [Peptostreptococcus porci]